MLHTLLHLYNQAPPRVRRTARAGAAFALGIALGGLVASCAPAYAGIDRGTIAPKPRGPVRKNTFSEAVAAPTEKRGFVTPKFHRCRKSGFAWFWGVVGVIRKDARTASDVFLTTTLHPTRVRTLKVALVTPEGAKTMTATPVASASASASTRTPTITTEEQHAFALLQAASHATMAKMYLHQGNIAGARRKAVCLLKALQTLEFKSQSNQPQSHTQQAPAAIKKVANKGGKHV